MTFKVIYPLAVKFTLFLSLLKEIVHVNQHMNKDIDMSSVTSKMALALRPRHSYRAEHPCVSISASGNESVQEDVMSTVIR